ncbi:MAG: hypothetical protein A2W00_13330 [Candidatus Eisenbacteria bacterium RBG_16_71_46]|nr:MAG: hypothetical protein A2W00_13330 [Candidatus Eisenbacteria bacterium RBG_16_71_46]
MVAAEPYVAGTTTDFGLIQHGESYPQRDFFNSEADYPLYYGGVGIGKTRALVVDFFDYAGRCPGSRQIITEPTWGMVRDVLVPTIEDCYGPQEGVGFSMTRQPPIDVRFPNGSEIWLRSTDVRPERVLGSNVARVGMDEITLGHQEQSFDYLAGRLRQEGFFHQVKCTGTPKGRNWVWKRFIDAPMPGVHVYFAETADNPKLPPNYMQRMLATYGGWDNPLARQELAGQWLQMTGQVFPQFSRAIHVRETDVAWKTLKNRLGGIDFGGVSPTALIACGLDSGDRARAYAEWYKRQATLDETMSAMAHFQVEWGVEKWIADPSGKKEIDLLRKAGFKVSPAKHGNRIMLRVQILGARLNVHPAAKLPGMYISPYCHNLIMEIETLTWKPDVDVDQFERGAPDHAVDALTNVLTEYDGVRAARKGLTEPVLVYGDY